MATHTTNFNLSKPDPTDTQSSFISEYCNNMDKIDQNLGGGGGSSVSWQQLQVTGDKIATIRISGIDTDVYSPNSQTFTMAVSRANINSDETYSTIFGKIKKWFNDLKTVAFSGSYNDLSNTPTKVSDFTNDSGFVTSTVNNLANYYLKSETYTQAQVDALIGAISTISIEVVQSLPTQDIKTNTIYLVPKQTAGTQNVYDEYIYVNNAWELIGDTEIDLSNYVTTTDLATALQDYVTSTGLSTILANYYTSSQIDTLLGGKVNDVEVNGTSVVNGQGVAEVTVPTKTSDLNNDSGYLTDSDVSVTQVVSSGTKIATIDVNGTSTDLYAPASGGGSVNDVTVNGTSVVNAQGVAEVTVPDDLADLADDSTHRTVTDTEKSTWSAKVSDNPTFTEASTRANIASGESFATILGKIKKFFTDLKTVAFTGSYNDLSDKPTIPSAQVNSDWNANSGVAQILNKPSLATVATSGKSSDLNNDAGFITSDDTKIPLKTDYGLGYIYGNGESGYCIIADIDTNAVYLNYPIYLEISGRGVEFTNVCIQFKSKSSPDPDLDFFHIDTNNKGYFRLFKISSGLWRLYFLIGSWETCTLHRISGSGSNRCTVKMEKTTTLPDTWSNGIAPTFGGYSNFADTANSATTANTATYATSAGTATDNTKVAKTGDTMTGSLEIQGGDLILDTSSGGGNMLSRQTSSPSNVFMNTLPAKDGTIAMTSDIPTNTNQLTNGAGFLTGADLLLKYGTPFMFANDNNSKVKFTFSGMGGSESIHLLLFIRYGAYEIYCTCSATGFGSATCTKLNSNSMDLTVTASNNSYEIIAGITTWSSGYGLFVHPHFPNATMTITKYS